MYRFARWCFEFFTVWVSSFLSARIRIDNYICVYWKSLAVATDDMAMRTMQKMSDEMFASIFNSLTELIFSDRLWKWFYFAHQRKLCTMCVLYTWYCDVFRICPLKKSSFTGQEYALLLNSLSKIEHYQVQNHCHFYNWCCLSSNLQYFFEYSRVLNNDKRLLKSFKNLQI